MEFGKASFSVAGNELVCHCSRTVKLKAVQVFRLWLCWRILLKFLHLFLLTFLPVLKINLFYNKLFIFKHTVVKFILKYTQRPRLLLGRITRNHRRRYTKEAPNPLQQQEILEAKRESCSYTNRKQKAERKDDTVAFANLAHFFFLFLLHFSFLPIWSPPSSRGML